MKKVHTDFVPADTAGLIIWLTNIKDKITANAAALGLTAAQAAAWVTKLTGMIATLTAVEPAKNAYESAVATAVAMRRTDMPVLREEITRWKSLSTFTPALEGLFQVVSTSAALDFDSYKAEIAVAIAGNEIVIRFTKKGVDSVNIYYRHKGTKEWIFLARDTKSPYKHEVALDKEGVPIHLEYIAYGLVDDVQIGQPSDIAQIVYGG